MGAVVAASENEVSLADTRTQQTRWRKHIEKVHAITHDDSLVFTGTVHGIVSARSQKDGKECWQVTSEEGVKLICPQNRSFLCGAGNSGAVVAWSCSTGDELWRTAHAADTEIQQLAATPDGSVFSGDDCGNVFCWEHSSGKRVWKARFNRAKRIQGMVYLKNLDTLCIGTSTAVAANDAQNGAEIFYQKKDDVRYVQCCNDFVVTATPKAVSVWNAVDGRENWNVVVCETSKDRITSLVGMEDIGAIGIGTAAGRVVVYRLANGELQNEIAVRGSCSDLLYSPA